MTQNKPQDRYQDMLTGDGARVILAVAVAAPVGGIYDYFAGPASTAKRGSLVIVPFGGRQLGGIVMGPAAGDVPVEKLRNIERLVALSPLSESMVTFIERVADWTMTPIGGVVRMVLSQPMALAAPPQRKHYRGIGQIPTEARRTPAREKVMAYLATGLVASASDITTACGVSGAVLDGMVDQNMIAVEMLSADRPPPRPSESPSLLPLTADQQTAARHLVDAVGAGFQAVLLDGVTGSGKTEVYFAAVEAAIQAGRQVLILLPEIALSAAWRHRFAARFGVFPVEWHSDIAQGQKRATWRFVLQGKVSVVVGARSALFLPFDNLGLIIVDEEHEQAFKQEDQAIYQARDMAVLRARLEQVPVVLATATPSLESWVNAGRTGDLARYRYLALPNRVQGASLPQIELVDLRATPPESGRWLAPPLIAAIESRLQAGEQSLLYLNRRGYAPLTMCGACGSKVTCPNCDAWLVAHRLAGRMKCHHCGHESRPREACSVCGETDQMRACGPGVERLAEEVLWRFPEARFAVLSSDTVTTPKAAEIFVQSVIDGEVDIIIGTQMAAKGHHFPALTLVGVVDADLGLAGGDLRASERTFQMLSQVAGRAGRESRPGQALLQTLEPQNQVLLALLAGDRDRFLDCEAAARKAAKMPPFGQLAAVVLSTPQLDRLHQAMLLLDAARPWFDGVDIFGPTVAPLGFLKGKHRARALIRAEKSVNIQAVLRQWLGAVSLPTSVRLQIDIDPYHFL
jgi:primosomal protein N' (replication factor Y)